MAWTTPKTNWVATDYFNYSDYNRIVGNIIHLKSMFQQLFPGFTMETMESTKTEESMIYASEINAIENNLEKLNLRSYRLNIGSKKTYKVNGATTTYDEFNRIESACLSLFNTMSVHANYVPHLAIRLGGDKILRSERS